MVRERVVVRWRWAAVVEERRRAAVVGGRPVRVERRGAVVPAVMPRGEMVGRGAEPVMVWPAMVGRPTMVPAAAERAHEPGKGTEHFVARLALDAPALELAPRPVNSAVHLDRGGRFWFDCGGYGGGLARGPGEAAHIEFDEVQVGDVRVVLVELLAAIQGDVVAIRVDVGEGEGVEGKVVKGGDFGGKDSPARSVGEGDATGRAILAGEFEIYACRRGCHHGRRRGRCGGAGSGWGGWRRGHRCCQG